MRLSTSATSRFADFCFSGLVDRLRGDLFSGLRGFNADFRSSSYRSSSTKSSRTSDILLSTGNFYETLMGGHIPPLQIQPFRWRKHEETQPWKSPNVWRIPPISACPQLMLETKPVLVLLKRVQSRLCLSFSLQPVETELVPRFRRPCPSLIPDCPLRVCCS